MAIEVPLEHSDLVGGSSASRVLNCPGSVSRIKRAPKSKGSSYAREGTALHEMIAQVLDHAKEPEEMLPFTHDQPAKGVEGPWSLTITQSIWDDNGAPALDMFDDFLVGLERDQSGEPATFMIEERGAFPGIPGAFGTTDVVFRCGKIGGIWDWKFGRNPVNAEENSQMLFYFATMFAKYPKFFAGCDRVVLCIGQPKVNDLEPSIWETDMMRVLQFIEELQQAVKDAEAPDAFIAKGPWCAFQDCKAVCELHYGAAAHLGSMMNDIKQAKGPDLDAFMSDAMELAEMAEAWSSHIRSLTHEMIDSGKTIEGWKTVAKRSSGREWTMDDEEVRKKLRNRGLTSDEFAPRSTVSAPQAEKLLKKIGKELWEGAAAAKPSSGTTLTRDGDPRASALAPAAKAAALGAALARHLEK